jgi:hypothetical protein
MAPQNPATQESLREKVNLESRPLWAILLSLTVLRGLSRQMSLLEILHQSLIFLDQLCASLPSTTLHFK